VQSPVPVLRFKFFFHALNEFI